MRIGSIAISSPSIAVFPRAALALALIAGLGGCSPVASQLPPSTSITLALRGGRVLDVESGRYSDPSVVLISGDRITDIVPLARYTGRADSSIDVTGLTLLPGLIDAHVHLAIGGPLRANALADLRAGFTTVVDLGALSHRLLGIRDSINSGSIPGPRVLAAGMWVGIKGGVCEFTGIGIAGGPDAFRERIRANIAAGADVTKLCVSGWPAEAFSSPDAYQLTDEIIAASVDESHRLRRKVIAHDISLGGVRAALRGGVDGLAHAAYLDSATSREMAARGVFMIPTLASLTAADPSSPANQALASSVGMAYRLRVPLVFGTDGGVLPHGGNAAEFAAMVRAGVSPLDAIRSATVNAARAFALTDSLGTVRKGMLADVVVVSGDPLTDVTTLATPRFVLLRGRVVRAP